MDIKVITAANSKMRGHLQVWKRHVESVGYTPIIYDLGGLGEGKRIVALDEHDFQKKDGIVRCNFKPHVIYDAIENNDADLFVWLDCDALIQDRVDELTEQFFDVGFTLRSYSELQEHSGKTEVGFANAGVLFFRGNAAVCNFLLDWCGLSADLGIEQKAFNAFISKLWGDWLSDKYFPGSKEAAPSSEELRWGVEDIVTKGFATEKYNNYYFDRSEKTAKIVHYKGEHRKKFPL